MFHSEVQLFLYLISVSSWLQCHDVSLCLDARGFKGTRGTREQGFLLVWVFAQRNAVFTHPVHTDDGPLPLFVLQRLRVQLKEDIYVLLSQIFQTFTQSTALEEKVVTTMIILQ